MKKPSSIVSAILETRNIKQQTRLLLYVCAGGRCEFEGCNKYLVKHPLTQDSGNFAEVAHIVAFKERGPRGKDQNRPADINDIENLMLLCDPCHHLVDKVRPEDYPKTKLEGFKHRHERRVFLQTEAREDYKTSVVQLRALINGHMVDIPVENVRAAVAPRYVSDPKGFVIDLTGIEGDDENFTRLACDTIKNKVARIYDKGMGVDETRHISLFALAPIPLLIYLGNQLSNKIPVDAYQRHRDTEDWVWKSEGLLVEHKFRRLKEGQNLQNVALLLSLSGTLKVEDLPSHIDDTFYIYEITLENVDPNPTYLRLRSDLGDFKATYQNALRDLERMHVALKKIHLFPAVPAPIAVHCGRELLPKVDPALLVYDKDKRKGGFRLMCEVNN